MALTWIAYGLVLLANIQFSTAGGTGMIGLGKTMYNPTCAFACRAVIASCPLLCTGKEKGAKTPPECYATDQAFMRTLAMCINSYCSQFDHPSLAKIEGYWVSHLTSPTFANFTWTPAMSYGEALRLARMDEKNSTSHNGTASTGGHKRQLLRRHGSGAGSEDGQMEEETNSTLPAIRPKAPLNVTSVVRKADWQKNYNGLKGFEANEAGHATYTLVVTMVALFMPLLLSLPRFIPGLNRSRTWLWINSILVEPPVLGKSHREPVAKYIGGGLMPTRGQALYIILISVLNIIFLLAPYTVLFPQSVFATMKDMEISTIGNRAGNLAMGNLVALFVFSARNNILLWLTDWPYDTYVLLHRWLGYWTILHAILHSIMLWVYYSLDGTYAEEAAKKYWIWGIVATVCATALWPCSLLMVRQKAYELFLCTHQVLVVFFIVGYYYHIWELYKYNWGYEIWAFVAITVWILERLARLLRAGMTGMKTAIISPVEDSDGDYLRVEIENVFAEGVAYLYFPTLSWRVWENHPFSIASSFSTMIDPENSSGELVDAEKAVKGASSMAGEPCLTASAVRNVSGSTARVNVAIRVRSGMTARLAARVSAANGPIRIPVFLEGSYHSSAGAQISQCTRVLCIAGGVGLSAVLPILHRHANGPARLCWGIRNHSLKAVFKDEMNRLPAAVDVETHIGSRMDVSSILTEELTASCGPQDRGPIGVIVCGPPGMADDVRNHICSIGKAAAAKRGIILIDETFSW